MRQWHRTTHRTLGCIEIEDEQGFVRAYVPREADVPMVMLAPALDEGLRLVVKAWNYLSKSEKGDLPDGFAARMEAVVDLSNRLEVKP